VAIDLTVLYFYLNRVAVDANGMRVYRLKRR